jgi:hypothetical protein
MNLAKNNPSHQNVPDDLKNITVKDEDIAIIDKISEIHDKLYSLIHHRNDPENVLNYPLFVSLYDVTRVLGGFEEGGWWYVKYELINSIEIKNPNELVPTAEKLYAEINNFDGKPVILVENEKGSQIIKDPPQYS